MDIANLLAQGVQIRPQGMEQNALMQYQQFQDAKLKNALMQYQLSQAQRQDALGQQTADAQAQWRNSLQMPQEQPFVQPGRPAMNAAMADSAVGTPGYSASSATPQMGMTQPDPRMVALTGAAKAGLIAPADYVKAAYPDDNTAHAPAGSVIYDKRTGKYITSAPEKNDAPSGVKEYQFAVQQGYKGTLEQFLLDQKRAGATTVSMQTPVPIDLGNGQTGYVQPANRPGAPPQLMTNPQGGKPFLKPDSDALNDNQAKALLFSSRMLAADKTLADLNRKGVTNSLPGAGGNGVVASGINAVQSPERQQLDQAKRDFINAVLRRESGAAIAQSEFDSADKQYFPQPGDARPVIEQKAANRRRAIEGMRVEIPKSKQGEVDRIAGGASAPMSAGTVLRFDANGEPVK